MMTLKQLEIFTALAQNPHISAVAQQLALTQSAVSMSLKSLEEHLEEKLFDRIHKKLVLNEKGRHFYKNVEPLLERLKDVERDFMGNKLSGDLNVGVSSSLAAYILPRIIFQFMEEYKGVNVKMETGNTQEVVKWVETGHADVGFVEAEFENDAIVKDVFGIDELFVVSGDPKFAEKETYNIEELYDKRWIMREKGSGTRETFLSHLGCHAEKINVFMELDHTDSVKSVLLNRDTLSCLSQFSINTELRTKQLFSLKIKGIHFKRALFTVRHKHKHETLLLKTFIDYSQTIGVNPETGIQPAASFR